MQERGFRSPAPVLGATSLAIVGASDRAKWPAKIHQNLRRSGFAGPIFPINPRYEEIWGERCYPDFSSLPQMPEHALFIIPAKAVIPTLEEAAKAGLKAATIYSGGLGEGNDPDAVRRGEKLKALVRDYDITLAGPNCMGAMSMHKRYFVYPNSELTALPVGGTALVFQSGGTLQFWSKTAAERGVRFSYLISSGNELALDLADYVNYLVDDPDTRVITLFVEGVRRPQAFMQAAARAMAVGKPIVAIKTGRSQKSREAAESHTGAIGGDYATFEALCDRYGIVLCRSLDEMLEIVLALQPQRLPRGRRVGVYTTSGGTVDLLHDYIDDLDGKVIMPDFAEETKAKIRPLVSPDIDVKNPLDAGIPSDEATAAAISRAIAEDPNVDTLLIAGQLPTGSKGMRDVSSAREVFEGTEKPIFGFSRMAYTLGPDALATQEGFGFPFLQGLPEMLRCVDALAFVAERRGQTVSPLADPTYRPEALEAARLDDTLARHGLTPPKSGFATNAEAAGQAAAAIGFPVALKLVSPQFSHKTEIDGVRLNLRSVEAVEAEAQALERRLAEAAPDAVLDGFLVQEMVGGVEVILGARTDPLYGPVMVVGAGGIFVELMKDISTRLLPVGRAEARKMLDELRIAPLLSGFRGRPAADVEALITAICGLSDLYLDHRDHLADFEVNPLIVLPVGGGVRAVDVRIVRRDHPLSS